LVNWVSFEDEKDGLVEYGTSRYKLNLNVVSKKHTYTQGGFNGWIHNALLQNLNDDTTYYYHCGDNNDWSDVYSFNTSSSKQREFQAAWIADMDLEFSQWTVDALTRDAKAGVFDLLLHAGDISYANDRPWYWNNSYVFDDYMKMITPIISEVPYMVATGNHESQFEFAAYTARYPTGYLSNNSGSSSNFWYSFDYNNLVHFISYSTEHSFEPGSLQYKWLEQDLMKADQNRKNVPWIVMYGHRALYCTGLIDTWIVPRCSIQATMYRGWIEDLLYKYHLDVYFCGHNHQYERSYPVYKSKSTAHHYNNPNATVYIVNGAAGSIEQLDPTFSFPGPEWRGSYNLLQYGYSLMNATPKTLTWSFINANWDRSTVTDSFTITKS